MSKFVFQEIFNKSEKDFVFYWDSEEYVIPANSKELLPDFLARHAAKKMADKSVTSPLNRVEWENAYKSFLGNIINKRTDDITRKNVTSQEIAIEKAKLLNSFAQKDDIAEIDRQKNAEKPSAIGTTSKS